MPRPKKRRWVSECPKTARFGPTDIPPNGELDLSMEEMEAIRLSDFERMDQDAAAQLMGVSRQTYGRILAAARGRVAEALVTGKGVNIGGGHYVLRERRGGRGRHGAGHRFDTTEGEDMPRGDGTGPNGQGPAGRGRGPCGGGAGNRGGGRGAGGRGMGQGGGGKRGGAGRGQGRAGGGQNVNPVPVAPRKENGENE
ncbi:MAG: DUF134 domain-containing protein [Desulfococcaceae bacterium]